METGVVRARTAAGRPPLPPETRARVLAARQRAASASALDACAEKDWATRKGGVHAGHQQSVYGTPSARACYLLSVLRVPAALLLLLLLAALAASCSRAQRPYLGAQVDVLLATYARDDALRRSAPHYAGCECVGAVHVQWGDPQRAPPGGTQGLQDMLNAQAERRLIEANAAARVRKAATRGLPRRAAGSAGLVQAEAERGAELPAGAAAHGEEYGGVDGEMSEQTVAGGGGGGSGGGGGTAAELQRAAAPIRVALARTDSLNERFRPPPGAALREVVLSVDDDVVVSCADVCSGAEAAQSFSSAMVGFYPRLITRAPTGGVEGQPTPQTQRRRQQQGSRRPADAIAPAYRGWLRGVWLSGEYNVVLTKAAFLRRAWLETYVGEPMAVARAVVDAHSNCEDLAMAYMVANMTRAPPLWVRTRSTPVELARPGAGISTAAPWKHRLTRDKCAEELERAVGLRALPTSNLKLVSTTAALLW